MKVKDLKKILSELDEMYDDNTVCVVVRSEGVIGGTPVVNVESANAGFDWNSGKFMLRCDQELRVLEKPEYMKVVKNKGGWSVDQSGVIGESVFKLKKDAEAHKRNLARVQMAIRNKIK